jgi:FG-GAP repeat
MASRAESQGGGTSQPVCQQFPDRWACEHLWRYEGTPVVDDDGHMGMSVAGWGDFDGGGSDILIGGGGKIEEACSFPPQVGTLNDPSPSKAWLVTNPPGCAPFPCLSSTTTEFVWLQTDPAQTEIRLGHSVAFLGDIDGDGYGEIAIGAPLWTSGGMVQRGAVYVIFGSPTTRPTTVDVELGLPLHRGVRLRGATQFDWFGYSVAGAGDVGGDGVRDLLVGAPTTAHQVPGIQYQPGAAYLIDGAFLAATAAVGAWPEVVVGPTSSLSVQGLGHKDREGYAVCGMGDVTGDGRADIVVGAVQSFWDCAEGGSFRPANNGTGYVEVWAHDGSTTSPALALVTRIRGEALQGLFDDGDFFGKSVTSFGAVAGEPGGDVNGDGKPDLAVGAPHWDIDVPVQNSPENQGKVYVYSGLDIAAGSPIPSLLLEYHATASSEKLGWSIAGTMLGAPGPEPARLAVGSRNYSEWPVSCGGSNMRGKGIGAVRIFCLPTGVMTQIIRGEQDRDHLGFSVAWGADLAGASVHPELVAGGNAHSPLGCVDCMAGCCEIGIVYVFEF